MWLAGQRFAQRSQQFCMEEYVAAVEQASERVQRLEAEIRELVSQWSLGPLVSAMSAHRGVALVVAATVCAELGDLTRFERPRELMGFVGLVPSLRATGLSHRTGAITKTGNAHVRRVLVEAAWSYVILHAGRSTCEANWRVNLRRCRRSRGRARSGCAAGTAG